MSIELDENAESVRLVNLFTVEEDRMEEAEALLQGLITKAEAAPHCKHVELLRDVSDPARLVLQIDFDSIDDLQAYLEADWRQDALKALPGMLQGELHRAILTRVHVSATS